MDARGPLPDLDGVFAGMPLDDAGDNTADNFFSADTNAYYAADNFGANSADAFPLPLASNGDTGAAVWSGGDPGAYTEQQQQELYDETGYGDHQWTYGEETEPSLEEQLEALKAYEELEEVQQAADEWITQLPDTIRSSLVENSDLLEKFAPQATPAMQALAALAPEELEDVCLRLLQRPTAQEIYAEVQAVADAAEYDEDEDAKVRKGLGGRGARVWAGAALVLRSEEGKAVRSKHTLERALFVHFYRYLWSGHVSVWMCSS
jgi:hypothetical protein